MGRSWNRCSHRRPAAEKPCRPCHRRNWLALFLDNRAHFEDYSKLSARIKRTLWGSRSRSARDLLNSKGQLRPRAASSFRISLQPTADDLSPGVGRYLFIPLSTPTSSLSLLSPATSSPPRPPLSRDLFLSPELLSPFSLLSISLSKKNYFQRWQPPRKSSRPSTTGRRSRPRPAALSASSPTSSRGNGDFSRSHIQFSKGGRFMEESLIDGESKKKGHLTSPPSLSPLFLSLSPKK